MISVSLCGVAITLLSACRGPQASSAALDFWVAPDGDDANPGTTRAPFLTLTRARDAARLARLSPRRIVVKGGKYFGVSLTLGPEDSGLTICAAPGQKPVLYGGILITNWNKAGNIYSAPVTNAAGENIAVRSLVVADQWRDGARFPSNGTLKNLNEFKVRWMSTSGGGWERKPVPQELNFMRYRAGDIPVDLNAADAEVTIFHKWDESRVGVISNDVAAGVLQLASSPGHPPGAFGVHDYILWNTCDGLNHPGQWYNDRKNGVLNYWPLKQEAVESLAVVVPTNTCIIRVKGGARPVRNVTLDGLALVGTSTPLMAGGFAAEKYDGAISLAKAENCSLRNLTISVVGGHGIKASGNDLRITGCVVRETGAGGIYAHGNDIVISNNLVEKIGLNYPSSVGIMGGHGVGGFAAHNEVRDCPYSAFCFGGVTNFVFEENLVHDCMKVLGDGAAFYVFAGNHCLLRRNLARDFKDVSGGAGASAYYLDERSTRCVVEQNISLRVAQPVQNHMATNNVIQNNIFIGAGDLKLTFPRSAHYIFARNIVQAGGQIRIDGVNAIGRWEPNVFWATNGIRCTELERYAASKVSERLPEHGLMVDPDFRGWARGDVSLPAASPARAIGFVPFSLKGVGRM